MGFLITTADLATGMLTINQDGVITTRPMTAEEIATETAAQAETVSATNRAILYSKAQSALTANATFLTLGSPTNAQAVAQVQALTRQVDALIRVMNGLLDTIADT